MPAISCCISNSCCLILFISLTSASLSSHDRPSLTWRRHDMELLRDTHWTIQQQRQMRSLWRRVTYFIKCLKYLEIVIGGVGYVHHIIHFSIHSLLIYHSHCTVLSKTDNLCCFYQTTARKLCDECATYWKYNEQTCR
ncbi:hypothetical protein NP493_246g01017 [Ridgeia piscesae]|uniref:Secreted protein n=1 Tax=Ridgeia piscesae TaxID=27915 RepID=A0AAD9UD71_RIDPI|nr:hypothetical protein NP493_246g01017 [Ridgeia piscesae]